MNSYLISIAGNIAAGKSTLTKALEMRTSGKIVSFLERVDYVKENGYLQKYYEAVSAYDRLKGAKLVGKARRQRPGRIPRGQGSSRVLGLQDPGDLFPVPAAGPGCIE